MSADDAPVPAFGPTPLSPLRFLDRSTVVFADRTAVVDGDLVLTYRELGERCARLTGALVARGVAAGDRVAALCANSHVMIELHHGVPGAGAVLVPLNVRLAVDELVQVVEHAGARLLVATHEHADVARRVAERVGADLVVAGGADDAYAGLLAGAEPAPSRVDDESALLALNYTSGTTGTPKGAMYHHRGAYLQSLAMAYHAGLGPGSRYLWTLPMFHCDGWCFPWAVTAAGATHVCLRAIEPERIWTLLREEGITHLSAAPTVLTMIAEEPSASVLAHDVHVDTGGAPPTPTLLERLAGLRMSVTHLYGLTETFGPVAVNQWQPQWDGEPPGVRARLLARQGVANVAGTRLRVVHADGTDVPADATTSGEVVVRGDAVMVGYYRDPDATRAASLDGWFRTGDLAVVHPDGYLELVDRSKDVIISGGENISSVEVERALDAHPDVLESAVVARPDERWGEVPVAFVTLRPGRTLDADALRAHLRERIARFKVPREIHEAELPRTSTGKIRKNSLRATVARESGRNA